MKSAAQSRPSHAHLAGSICRTVTPIRFFLCGVTSRHFPWVFKFIWNTNSLIKMSKYYQEYNCKALQGAVYFMLGLGIIRAWWYDMNLDTQVAIQCVPWYDSVQFDTLEHDLTQYDTMSLKVTTQVDCITSMVYRNLAMVKTAFVFSISWCPSLALNQNVSKYLPLEMAVLQKSWIFKKCIFALFSLEPLSLLLL